MLTYKVCCHTICWVIISWGRTRCACSKAESKLVSEVLERRKQSALCSRNVSCVANTEKQSTSRQTNRRLFPGRCDS